MQVLFLKVGKLKSVEGWKLCLYPYFSTHIFSRMGRKTERCRKIKIIILVFEFLSFGLDVFLACGFLSFLIRGLMSFELVSLRFFLFVG